MASEIPAVLNQSHRAYSEHMLEMVRSAQVSENSRQAKLEATKTRKEALHLEKRFVRERRAEEKKIKQMTEEHKHFMQVRMRLLFSLYCQCASSIWL